MLNELIGMIIQISFDDSVDPGLVDPGRIEKLVAYTLESENVKWSQVGIVFTGHEHLRSMNRDYLGHDYDTDVLSFLIDKTEAGIEGEVYVDVETADERHTEFGSSLREEIERYVVHGLLHLAGYDDDTSEKKQIMHDLESKVLSAKL